MSLVDTNVLLDERQRRLFAGLESLIKCAWGRRPATSSAGTSATRAKHCAADNIPAISVDTKKQGRAPVAGFP